MKLRNRFVIIFLACLLAIASILLVRSWARESQVVPDIVEAPSKVIKPRDLKIEVPESITYSFTFDNINLDITHEVLESMSIEELRNLALFIKLILPAPIVYVDKKSFLILGKKLLPRFFKEKEE